MLITVGLILLMVLVGLWEFRRHQRIVAAIPIRVHVNGTRGKSSVTRLIAAGMRAGGIRTFAKTTGTKPRLINTDGSEVPIFRPGKANIIEQVMVFRRAVEQSVVGIVVECMAIDPSLQLLVEKKMVRSAIGVLTNVRADHLDEMGPSLEQVARSLSSTMPANGVLFTTEREHLPIIQEKGRKLNCTVVPVVPDDITDRMMAGFPYLEHTDNVALALAVCGHLGIDRQTALEAMYAYTPDPGVLRIFRINSGGKEVEFINAFAANDPDSSAIIWELLRPFRSPDKKLIVLVNVREDKIQRSEQMGEFIAALDADHFILAGRLTNALGNRAVASGVPQDRIVDLGNTGATEIFERILSLTPSRSMVVGIGNIVGLGEKIVSHFINRGKEIAYRSS